jgi:hypothetical protein
MKTRLTTSALVCIAFALGAHLHVWGSAPANGGVPRTPNGRPDLSGVWQVLAPAAWNLEGHSAADGVPAGQGVVIGNQIPYQPWALEKRREHAAKRAALDPESKCFLPGVPRLTLMPFPFQILQSDDLVLLVHEYARAVRHVHTNGSKHPDGPIEWWLGDSRGRWEGDTLVVDVVHFTDQTWLDRAGNFHSDALHVVERFTPDGPDHLRYHVTIEDSKVFTRPWEIETVLYRRKEKHVQVLDYNCYGFRHESLYP